jgi:uncharacterized damage-inducible protein DinB
MTIADDLPTLFAFNRWADGLMMEAVFKLSPDDYTREVTPGWASVRSTVLHLGGVMHIYASRLAPETVPPFTGHPTERDLPDMEDAARLIAQGHDAFDRMLATMTPERLASLWEGPGPGGKRYRIPYWAIFRHVANHASYHRGQVASKLKRLGVEPPKIDMILWIINQTPQPTE